MNTYIINFQAIGGLTQEQFYQICQKNPELKLERSVQGELIIRSPSEEDNESINAAPLTEQFFLWNSQTKLGQVFDSSTCFQLPSGSNRSPNVAWVRQERWEELTPEQREKFPPLAPDFVLELMFPDDRLTYNQAKMQEYRENGVRLGWLINTKDRQVEIYRQRQEKEILDNPNSLSGENILPGFTLDLQTIWK